MYWSRYRQERPEWLARPRAADPLEGNCRIAECRGHVVEEGLCLRHWTQARRIARAGQETCANPICAQVSWGGYTRCQPCYIYFWRHGRERPERWAQPQSRRCRTPGCGRPWTARRLCQQHYAAWLRARRRPKTVAS